MTDTNKILTPKQLRFCAEYLIDSNGTQAAIRAGYSPKTANEQAAHLLAKISIKAEIDRKKAKLAQKTEITAERIVRELAKIAFADMKEFTRWSEGGVVLINSADLTPDQTAAVAEVSQTVNKDGGSIKFKLHDKARALELLGKHFGIYTDKVRLDSDLTVNIVDHYDGTNRPAPGTPSTTPAQADDDD